MLSTAYEYAIENRYVKENPVLRSRMPSFPHSIKKDVPEYNAEQVRKLLLYAKEHESVQTSERIYIKRRKAAKETTINALNNAICFGSRKTVFVQSGIFFGVFLLLTKRNTPKMACTVPFRDVSCGRGRRT